MKQGRETTQEKRLQIAKECISRGKNYGEMALKYQVSYQQVRTWTLRYEQMGEAGLEDRRGQRKKDQTPRTELEQAQIEIEQLKHKLYLMEMENNLSLIHIFFRLLDLPEHKQEVSESFPLQHDIV